LDNLDLPLLAMADRAARFYFQSNFNRIKHSNLVQSPVVDHKVLLIRLFRVMELVSIR
jgi:hypothetical protein